MQVNEDLVVDPGRRLPFVGLESVYVTDFRAHPVVDAMQGLAVLLPVARSVTTVTAPGASSTILLTTSDQGWGETDLQSIADRQPVAKDAKDTQPPVSLGRGRPQLPHQHLLLGRARRLPFWMGYDRPSPTTPTPRVILLISAPPRDRPLLQPARAADHRGQAQRREAHRHRPAALEHRHARRPLAARRGRAASRRSCWRSQRPDPERPLRPRVRAALVELGGVPRARSGRSSPPTFEAFESALRDALRRATRSSSPSASRASPAAQIEEVAEIVAGAGTRLAHPQLAQRRRRQPRRLAGRRARCSC